MKKRIYFLLLSVVFIFSSCKDKSNEFVEQLFTDTQITAALNMCADTTAAKTCNTLCIVDSMNHKLGYYYFDSESYRIEFSADMQQIADTLVAHGYQDQVDSLLYFLNRAAEQCGNRITQFWKPIIKDMAYPNPNLVLHGGNSAITDYIKIHKQNEFVASLLSFINEQFVALDVYLIWDNIRETYTDITGITPSTSALNPLLTPTAEKIAAGFFKKMGIEEEAIRKYPALRGSPNGLLYRVFATL